MSWTSLISISKFLNYWVVSSVFSGFVSSRTSILVRFSFPKLCFALPLSGLISAALLDEKRGGLAPLNFYLLLNGVTMIFSLIYFPNPGFRLLSPLWPV